MSTIEGGMACTNDENLYQIFRMLRSHGMVRETTDEELSQSYIQDYPELNPEFIFAYPAYNMRNTEIGAVLGRNQLKRLDENNINRRKNFKYFLDNLDQLRQPYLQGIVDKNEYKNYPVVEHIHFYGFYIGNYPGLEQQKILKLCKILNEIK